MLLGDENKVFIFTFATLCSLGAERAQRILTALFGRPKLITARLRPKSGDEINLIFTLRSFALTCAGDVLLPCPTFKKKRAFWPSRQSRLGQTDGKDQVPRD
jgi:hypothetical protein